MNRTLFTLLVSLALLATLPVQAQDPSVPPSPRGRAIQKVKEARWAFLVYRLQLDEQRANRLLPIYDAYQAEKRAVYKGSVQQALKGKQDLSDDEADQLMDDRIENAKKILAIKEKYKKEFLKVISPSELLSLQQAEQDFALKIQAERQKRRGSAPLR